jgi:hypothetical protein
MAGTLGIMLISLMTSLCRNSLRLWLHPDGGPIPVVNNDYNNRMVTNITTAQIQSVQWVLDLGAKYDVILNLCLWSFDMVNDNGYGPAYGLWNKIITDEAHMNSYIDNWLVPFISTIKDHSHLLSVEVFNEPEGMIAEYGGWTNCQSGSSDCAKISILQAQTFTNRIASAVHDISPSVKVTVGSWSYLASSTVGTYSNIWSDSALVKAGGRINGVLDYYQIHYYNWAYPSYSPFVHGVEYWGCPEKPHVVGEFPNDPTGASTYFYEDLYTTGYAGAWGWGYNDGSNSEFSKDPFLTNMRYMQDQYGVADWPIVDANDDQSSECTDTYPYSDGYSCQQQASWGKCNEPFMASPTCDKSCGRCAL